MRERLEALKEQYGLTFPWHELLEEFVALEDRVSAIEHAFMSIAANEGIAPKAEDVKPSE